MLPSNRRPPGAQEAFQAAVAFHAQRRFWEAEQLYKRVLKADDRHFACLYQLALLYLQQSKFDDAARTFRRALNVNKTSAEANHHLAVALFALNRPEEAVQRYAKALAIRPDLAETHNNLGLALQALGKHEAAREHYQKAIALRTDYAEAHNNLGNALHKLGRSTEAVAEYEKALAINEDYCEAHTNLANVLVTLAEYEKAIDHHRQAVAAGPNDPEAHDHFGNTLHLLGRSDEAVSEHERAIAIRPDDPEFHSNLGQALQALGKLDQASHAFERAIALTPRKGRYYWSLANSKRFTPDDSHLRAMQEFAQDIGALQVDEQIELHFALGRALAEVGELERSFQHLLQGNTLKRRQLDYDEAKEMAQFARVQSVFTAKLLREKAGLGDPSPRPVFIIGLPRSGTTLIEQILASHPGVFGAGELPAIGMLAAGIGGANGAAFPEAVSSLSAQELSDLGDSYLRAIEPLAAGANRVTDKMLLNFMYVGLIHLALPNARIIHARRDLRDTALSCFSILFTNGLTFTYDLAELGRYCRAYQRLMHHWRAVLPGGIMLEIEYETLVDNLEEQARKLIAHCGLEWDPRCLAFHETQRSVRTASATQVRQPIYRSSVGRWRAYEPLLGPLLKELEDL
jgi:tetratricopeptide (TPR) repeat protein